MTNSRKLTKATVFSAIALLLSSLSVLALLHNHEPIITVQVEQVMRRNLTEIVTGKEI